MFGLESHIGINFVRLEYRNSQYLVILHAFGGV